MDSNAERQSRHTGRVVIRTPPAQNVDRRSVIDLDPQATLNLAQVLVKLTTQIRQPFVVGGFQGNIRIIGCSAQSNDVGLLAGVGNRTWGGDEFTT